MLQLCRRLLASLIWSQTRFAFSQTNKLKTSLSFPLSASQTSAVAFKLILISAETRKRKIRAKYEETETHLVVSVLRSICRSRDNLICC